MNLVQDFCYFKCKIQKPFEQKWKINSIWNGPNIERAYKWRQRHFTPIQDQ